MATTPHLLLPKNYIVQATNLVLKAQNRVFISTLIIIDDEATNRLLNALKQAAASGVEVSVCADHITYHETGSFFPSRKMIKKLGAMAHGLKKAGVQFHWLGYESIIAFTGRTHSKWCVIDDQVFSFGGVNLYKYGINNADYMFRLEDRRIADYLVQEQNRIIKANRQNNAFRSHSFATQYGSILFDGGFKNGSIIYKRAVELASQARQVIYVSQYCPSGKLARRLSLLDTRYFFNRIEQASSWSRLLIAASYHLTGIRTEYRRRKYIHAKFIIFTMPDGSRVALTGSHNFSHSGVMAGTREIALETTDPSIIAELEIFFNNHIA